MRRLVLLSCLVGVGCTGGPGGAPDASPDGACTLDGVVSFACGTATCTSAAPVCCLYTNLPAQCLPKSSTCFVDGGQPTMQTIECDDANDCGGAGHACCSSFNKGTSNIDSLCSCGGPGATTQLCKQSCECPGGKTCVNGSCN